MIDHWATEGRGPSFLPHVTLLGGVETDEQDMLDKSSALAVQLKRLYISFSDVTSSTTYFQCVFLSCNRERNLMEAHRKCCSSFGLDAGRAPYTPHCSLIYSDMPPNQRQEAVEASRERLYGNMQGYGSLLIEPGFWAEGLHVWETDGDDRALQSWREVAYFAFADSD